MDNYYHSISTFNIIHGYEMQLEKPRILRSLGGGQRM